MPQKYLEILLAEVTKSRGETGPANFNESIAAFN